jgi:hypothetical protein
MHMPGVFYQESGSEEVMKNNQENKKCMKTIAATLILTLADSFTLI